MRLLPNTWWRTLTPTLLGSLVLLVAGHSSSAAPLCIPNPSGIPGEPGAPEWWGVISGRREDPRWCGAMGVGHVANRAHFQVLQVNEGGTDYLYLSWEVRGDGGGGSEDLLYFGFLDPVSGTGTAFRITIPTDTGVGTVAKQVIGASQVQWRAKLASGVAWGAFVVSNGADAPWLQATGRYWVDCAAACSSYRVMLRVPIDPSATPADFDQGLDLANPSLFWYDIQVLQPGVPPSTAHHSLPASHPYSFANFLSPAYPTSSDWAPVQLGGGGCEPGVALDRDELSVTHGVSSPDHVLTTDNTLHAAPSNDSGGALAGDDVTTRFRLANWGSAGPGDAPTWDVIPGCEAATGTGVVSDGAGFDLTCDWSPAMATLCDYRPAGAQGNLPPWDVCIGPGSLSHRQWLLADLSAGPGATGDLFLPSASACGPVAMGDAIAVPDVSRSGRVLLATLLVLAACVFVTRLAGPSKTRQG